MKVFLVVGARPNFMKIAPIYELMNASDFFQPVIVHTGQHYDDNMSKVFFDDLELPRPDIYLGVGSGSHAEQTAEIMRRFEAELKKQQPEMVIVVGDVNSTIACALTTIKCQIPSPDLKNFWVKYDSYIADRKVNSEIKPFHKSRKHAYDVPLVAHIESGERSFDFSMPEEINRVGTDIFSDLLFTTSADSDAHLIDEGVDPRKVFCVGNIMIDSLIKFLKKAENSPILEKLNKSGNLPQGYLEKGRYALVTLHRAGNVDDPEKLSLLLSAISTVSREIPVVFPVHPRTRKLINSLPNNIESDGIQLADPVGYLDFLHLQSNARLILTDSGGIQVESSYLGIPCLTLRPDTEWRITLKHGTNKLVPLSKDEIVKAAKTVLRGTADYKSEIPLWDGKTAERIMDCFLNIFAS